MFQELRTVLANAGVHLGDEELLDALWLTARLPQGQDTPLARLPAGPAQDDTTASPAAVPTAPRPGPTVDTVPAAGDVPGAADVPVGRPRGSAVRPERLTPVAGSRSPDGARGTAVLLPGARVLGSELAIGRALRPLKRRIPSVVRAELDEPGTAAAQADTEIPNVVLKPLPERWLRLALVIDSDVSMVLWEHHCDELRAAFERSGAFRQIEVHQLRYRAPDTSRPTDPGVRLVTPWTGGTTKGRAASALNDPSGRTLVVVVTDGAAPAWQDGRMEHVLGRWAKAGPVCILHVLPRHLWAGTGVTGDTWHVTTPRAGAPSGTWQVTDPVLPSNVSSFRGVRVPVAEMTPAGLGAWASAITTVGRPVPLRLWEPRSSATHRRQTGAGARAFARTASPVAVRLAAHLAAVSPVTVPVMQLVQSCLPERGTTTALAEVFLSGLLEPAPRTGQDRTDTPVKHRLFDFTPEAKDLLLDIVPLAELLASSRRVGECVERLVGRSPDFPAWLLRPGSGGRPVQGPQPFALIGSALATRLGLDEPGFPGTGQDEAATERVESEVPTATVVILTSLPLEYTAVRAHLREVEERVNAGSGLRVQVGRLPGTPWRIALALTGPGADRTATFTVQMVGWFDPQAVLLVGIAGGLREDIGIGDVVIATTVYDGDSGEETPQGFLYRPRTWQAPHRLLRTARSALRERTHIHFKPIVAASVVELSDAASGRARWIRQDLHDAVAIDMESSGLAHAAHAGMREALSIHGISHDVTFGKAPPDAGSAQRLAAERAAEAAVAVLRELKPTPPPSDSPTGEGLGPVPVATTTLPAVTAGFTGREDGVGRLLDFLAPSTGSEPPVVVCSVSGLGGVGKTSLALFAAHRALARGWFPGGTLFVDLRGYADDPVSADQALLALLYALGVRGPDLPATKEARYDLYRRLLAERREPLLLILDNASTATQISPLVPPTEYHRVLVTSRDRLTDLDARLMEVDTLTPMAASRFITHSLQLGDTQDDRPVREPAAVAQLAGLCGHHPLALQIAAGMLRRRRHRSIASLVDELQTVDDPTQTLGLRSVFDTSYAQLPEEQAQVLRLLSLAPTAEVSTETAAALADVAGDEAYALLEGLASAHFVAPVQVGESLRWRLHDLVRDYARGVMASHPALAEGGAVARERLLDHYLRRTAAADARLQWLPGMAEPEEFGDRSQALAWLDVERAGLVTAAQWAVEERYSDTALRLAEHLGVYLSWRRYFDDWIAVGHAAREAAQRSGDHLAEAIAWNNLGVALLETGQFEEAAQAQTRALDVYRSTGDLFREAGSWNNLGVAFQRAGLWDRAIEAHTHARDLHQAVGNRHQEAMAWDNLGSALQEAGRMNEAVDAHVHGRDLYEVIGDRHSEARVWNNLGFALEKAGRAEEAIEAFGRALDTYREFDDWYGAGLTLENIARAHETARRWPEARAQLRRAAEAYTRAGAVGDASRVWDLATELPQ